MAEIKYSTLITAGTNAGLRLDKMIENEVRALLFDAASIRNSGALLFAGDIAGAGSAALSMRYAGLDGYEPMNTVADGTEISNTNLTSSIADITVGRIGLRYDLTDLAAMTKLGNDIDVFRLAGSMAGAFESRFMEMICALFSSATSSAAYGLEETQQGILLNSISNENLIEVKVQQEYVDLYPKVLKRLKITN